MFNNLWARPSRTEEPWLGSADDHADLRLCWMHVVIKLVGSCHS